MKFIFLMLFAIFTVLSCKKKVDPFFITPKSIGLLNKESKVQELETIYMNDSIVRRVAGDEFTGTTNEIEIFDKQGKALLTLEATEQFDSTATIKSVRIIDNRYKSKNGLSVASTFKDLKENYKISKISNTLGSIIVTIDELNAFVVISKKELPGELQFDTTSIIEEAQIPDTAKIKYFWLDWD